MSELRLEELARRLLVGDYWVFDRLKRSPLPWRRRQALAGKTKALIYYDRAVTGRPVNR